MKEKFEKMQKQYNVPDRLTLQEAADIMGVSIKEVRKQCQNGVWEADEVFPKSGSWQLPTYQFQGMGNWEEFLQTCKRRRGQSLRLATYLVEQLEDEEER